MYLLVKDAWRWNRDAPNYEVLRTSCQLTQVPQASESDGAPKAWAWKSLAWELREEPW